MFIVEGFHVPLIPLFDVVGNTGGVAPTHIGGMELNVGIKMGVDNIIPIKRSVVHPFICNEKSEYVPAFKPEIIICPDPFAVKETGPTATPSSV